MSDDDYKNILLPTSKSFDEFIGTYLVPEIVAFWIANAFNKNVFFERTFEEHFGDVFNDVLNHVDFPSIAHFENSKSEIAKLLKIKYSLDITSEVPLTLKRITY